MTSKRTRYSWETPAWAEPPHVDSTRGSDDEQIIDYESVSPEEASDCLVELITSMKYKGARMTANYACILAFWASKAGAVGHTLKKLGHHPGTHNYSRHFDSAMKSNQESKRERHYMLRMPMFRKIDGIVSCLEHPTAPMHEALIYEVNQLPDMQERLMRALPNLPPAYHSHPVVASAPAGVPVYPLALYLDGIPVTRHDGSLTIRLINLVTKVRHMYVNIKKSQLCRCGCKGWCTIRELLTGKDTRPIHFAPIFLHGPGLIGRAELNLFWRRPDCPAPPRPIAGT